MNNNHEAVRRIMKAINKTDGAYYYFARHLGINENTLAVFYALSDEKAHSQKALSNEWLIPKTTINTIIKNMAAEGYITLSSEHGTKEKSIALTSIGQEYADELLNDIYSAEEKAIEAAVKKYSYEFIDAFEYFSDFLCGEIIRAQKKYSDAKNDTEGDVPKKS